MGRCHLAKTSNIYNFKLLLKITPTELICGVSFKSALHTLIRSTSLRKGSDLGIESRQGPDAPEQEPRGPRGTSLRHCHSPGRVRVLCAQLLSHVQFFVNPWTAAHQAPLSLEALGLHIQGSTFCFVFYTEHDKSFHLFSP